MHSSMCGKVMLEEEGLAALVAGVWALLDAGGGGRRVTRQQHRAAQHLRLRIHRLNLPHCTTCYTLYYKYLENCLVALL